MSPLFKGMGCFLLCAAAGVLTSAGFAQSETRGWLRFPDGDMVRADPVTIEQDDWWLALLHASEPVQTSTPAHIWLSHKTDLEEEGPHRFLFHNGDVVTGTLRGWANASVRLKTYWGEEVTVPEKSLSAIEFREQGERIYLKGPAPLSDWMQRSMSSGTQNRGQHSSLEVGGSVHFKNVNRNHLTRTLNNMPTRFRLQAQWSSRHFSKLRHTLNFYRNRGLDAQTPNIVVNFSQGNAQVTTTAAHMRNREEIPIGTKSDRQAVEIYMDSETDEWIIVLNGKVRLQNSGKAMVLDPESSPPSSERPSRQLRWYSYSQDPVIFESLRIEEWTAAFPRVEADQIKLPKGKAGVMLRNGDTLVANRFSLKEETLSMSTPELEALPVPLRVVKRIEFRQDRWSSTPIGQGRYLVSLRDKTSHLRLGALRLADGYLSGQLVSGSSIQIPFESVAALQAGPRKVPK